MDAVNIDDVLRLQDFGLERLDEDQAILKFAQRAEARIARWLDFAKGALLMLMVPDDPESGCFYIYDRGREAFYSLGIPVDGRFGGFREDEFDGLCQAFGLKALAQNPQPLRALIHAVFGEMQRMPYINERRDSGGPSATCNGRNGRPISSTIREPPRLYAAILQAASGYWAALLLQAKGAGGTTDLQR